MTDSPKALCAENVHETAMAFLDCHRDAKIVDLPCGEGALLMALHQRGYVNLCGADINTEQVKVNNSTASIVYSDINERIGFDDQFADVVFCVECIEHIESPFHLIRELARITRPGGRVVISTPNVLSTNARSKYLSAGYFPHFKELSNDWPHLREMGFQGHVSPIPLNRLLFIAETYGLVFEGVKTNKFKRKPRLKDRLMGGMIRIASKRVYPDEGLYRLMTSDTVLFGDILIASFKKA